MKKKLFIILFFFPCIMGYPQKGKYTPKIVENPASIIERLIYNDPILKISSVNITREKIQIERQAQDEWTGAHHYEYTTVFFDQISKMKIEYRLKNLYKFKVIINRKDVKISIFTRSREDAQRCYDAFYTLKLRSK